MGSDLSVRQQTLHRRAIGLEAFTIAWNVIEAFVAIAAGIIAGSTALIAFGADSLIEVISAVALFWRLVRTGPAASEKERGQAERRALYVVAGTFFLLAAYVGYESIHSLVNREAPDRSIVGLVLSIISIIVMPLLAYAKQRTGREMGSKALLADSVETWVCSYLSFALLAGVGLHAAFDWWWADSVGALAMVPVVLWQGYETMQEAREHED